MRGIIDRFEGDCVVIEIGGQTRDFNKSTVFSNAKAGDVVILMDGLWILDIKATKQRENEIKKLMEDVWED
ncbi:DUF3006 domain-containing protein [Paenibacillus sp. NRS-1760]|uniref:DUF3006 domain-containing protein n=1 Tax=Paenibacillus sp. NRS-1760 TaxID=3233902 RepID=UPI003D2AA44B